MRLPFSKEALKLAFPLMLLAVVGSKIHIALGLVGGLSLLAVLAFFRDPKREISPDPNQILAPADGTILQIREADEGGARWTLLSIFMSVLNVHMNYAPVSGEVRDILYQKGSFRRANLGEASLSNESNTLVIRSGSFEVRMKQIAGILARRIVCYCKSGDAVQSGQKIGLIQFGSRVDLFLPPNVRLGVKVGDKVRGAKSVLGVWRTTP